MSTPARYAQAVVQPPSAVPATSTALVPVAADRAPRLAPEEKPVNAHWFFYGMGYTGLALVWAAMWLEGLAPGRFVFVYILAMMFVGLGGFGILIHTVYKPNERKVRHMLLAIGSLTLTLAASVPVERITREMYATAAVARLQPLAEALAKDGRVIDIGELNGNSVFNGFYGPDEGSLRVEPAQNGDVLVDVLARDGISREEYETYQQRLERAGMERAKRTASTVVFSPADRREPWLLYVMPGHALPPAHALLDETGTYHSQPLGGPWYMVLGGSD